MKRSNAQVDPRTLTFVKFLGPVTMLIIVFYILTTIFGLAPVLAGLIALGLAGFEFVVLSVVFSRRKESDSDRIG